MTYGGIMPKLKITNYLYRLKNEFTMNIYKKSLKIPKG